MSAIAERLSDPGMTALELASASPSVKADATLTLGLPPGSVPIEAVRSAVRSYRKGVGTTEALIRMVDRHGDALEGEIARKLTVHLRGSSPRRRFLGPLHVYDKTSYTLWLWPPSPFASSPATPAAWWTK